jgi:NADH:ubiquinone oxidoreductase subunit 6 (subunit J)
MGIFASPNRASIMNSVPRRRRGVSASTGTTLFYVGRTLSIGISFLIMTSMVSSEYVKSIIIDFRNSDKITATDNINSFGKNLPSMNAEIANKFLTSFHIIFFLSSILVFVAIIPATIKERHLTR